MTDEPFYSPKATLRAPRQPTPGEPLFEFVRASDDAPIRCELRDRGPFGVEAQFLERGELLISRRFDSRALAVLWAEEKRKAMEKDGV